MARDGMGWSLAAGNFGGGPEQDLAIGNPFDDPQGLSDAGSVNVLYGSGSGLTAAGSQLWTQNSAGIRNTSEPHDLFGFDVVAGDFTGGSQDDLAVGVPNETTGGAVAGAVNVIRGSGGGLTSSGNQFLNESNTGGTGQNGDGFGNALAAADFGGGTEADLAISAAADEVGSVVAPAR